MNARIRFEPSGIELTVEVGVRLLDAADEHSGVGLPLACRAGNCGACLVAIRSGTRALLAPTEHERETLEALGAPPDQRLACQLWLDSAVEPVTSPVVLSVVAARLQDAAKS